MKFAFFDFDGTLFDGETIELICRDYPEVYSRICELNQKGVQGFLDFGNLFLQKVQLFEGIPVETIQRRLIEEQKYFKGASNIISALKNDGFTVVVLSGGFNPALAVAQKALGFDSYFGNDLVENNGILTGFVRGPCMHQESKGELISKLYEITGASKIDSVAVGDGRNDVSMFHEVGFSVAFCSRSKALREVASVCVDEPDLTLVYNKISEYNKSK